MENPSPLLDGAQPFELGGGPHGVLLLHGFTGSPFEVRALGEHLAAAGHAVRGPLLPGHGRRTGSLIGVRPVDYLEGVEREFDRLAGRCESVSVVGLSLGGTLALHLATVRPVRRLVTIATPVFMPPYVEFGVPAASCWLPRAPAITNWAAVYGASVGYATAPMAAVNVMLQTLSAVRDRLGEVTAPLLVIHSTLDPSVPSSNAPFILSAVQSSERKLMLVPSWIHALTIPPYLKRIEAVVTRFIAADTRSILPVN